METVVLVVWTVGLVGALVATLVILKEAALVLQTLRHILALARRTSEAAEGVARNLAAVRGLRDVHAPAGEAREAAVALGRAVEGLSGEGDSPAPAGGEGGSPDGGGSP